MDEWKKQVNSRPYYVGILIVLVLFVFAWICYDNHRNKPIYESTDSTMAELEKRIDRIEQRVDSVSARLDQAEKTNTELGGRIESSTTLAKEVGNGIDGLQDRLDSAIQRSGRIANIIADIEAKNK